MRIALVPPLWARVAPGTNGGVEYIVYLLAEVRKARDDIFNQCGRSLVELGKYLQRRRKATGRKVVRLRRRRTPTT